MISGLQSSTKSPWPLTDCGLSSHPSSIFCMAEPGNSSVAAPLGMWWSCYSQSYLNAVKAAFPASFTLPRPPGYSKATCLPSTQALEPHWAAAEAQLPRTSWWRRIKSPSPLPLPSSGSQGDTFPFRGDSPLMWALVCGYKVLNSASHTGWVLVTPNKNGAGSERSRKINK